MNHIDSILSRVASGTQKELDLKRNLKAVNFAHFWQLSIIKSSCGVLKFTFLKNCLFNRKLLNYISEKNDIRLVGKYRTKQSWLQLNFSVHN